MAFLKNSSDNSIAKFLFSLAKQKSISSRDSKAEKGISISKNQERYFELLREGGFWLS
ncbi:hypothetical protein [Prochlorococcus sp. MIT 1223]|uniref:hypothetical protein n=1 Tax=Prochlorococcus sp. MIT 1223 TaxID=3096217 RepID=UPI002A7482FA|nr:hypothetical protein [Prochlorococcus sp. MIT 1223]